MAQAEKIWTRKDLIGIADLSREEIELILDTAPQFVAVSARESGIKKVPLLQGRLVVNWFHEPSTRTRISFELAAKRLSADTMSITESSSSSVKGETLHDTLNNIEAMNTDVIVLRHSCAGAAQILADNHSSHIINAGDGRHAHPTQALLDVFTMRNHIRNLRQDPNAGLDGVKVAIIGDIEHSRVARSDIRAMNKLGAHVTLCGPATPHAQRHRKDGGRGHLRSQNGTDRCRHCLRATHPVGTPTKGLFPSLREYIRLFRIDQTSLRYAPDHALVMHPGPINRDLELATEVADGPRSVILEQVSNGVAIRMAVMHLLVNSNRN